MDFPRFRDFQSRYLSLRCLPRLLTTLLNKNRRSRYPAGRNIERIYNSGNQLRSTTAFDIFSKRLRDLGQALPRLFPSLKLLMALLKLTTLGTAKPSLMEHKQASAWSHWLRHALRAPLKQGVSTWMEETMPNSNKTWARSQPAPWHALMALPRLKQLENSLNDSFSRASAIIQALALAQAAIAQLYVYVFGLTTAMSIWLKSDRACCHFCPLPQASIMVLYVITSGKQFANFISVKSCKLQCHLLALLKRLIALLNRKVWTSDCCACKAMQETIRGSRCKPFRSKNRQHSCNSCNYMFAPGIKPMLRSRGIDSKWLLSSMPIRSRKHPTHELLLPRMSWQIWPDWNAENQKLQIGLVRWFYVSKPISVQLAPSIASRVQLARKRWNLETELDQVAT